MKHEYRGRYERSELTKTKQAIPFAEARVEKYRKLLEEESKKLSELYNKQEQLEKEAA